MNYWVAAIQGRVDTITDPARRDETLAGNRSRAIALMDRLIEASASPIRLFQFPVLMLQGAYNEKRDEAARYAVSIQLPGPEVEPLIAFCARRDVYVASSCVERHPLFPGWFFHSGFILGPNGLVIRYPKAQARSAAGVRIIWAHYDEYVAQLGEDSVFPVADTPIGTLAICVEAEIHVPEVARMFTAKGVEVLCHPTVERAESHPWIQDSVKAARAYENQIYVVSANVGVARELDTATGTMQERRTRGGSSVHDPDGRRIAAIDGNGEGVVLAEIDLGRLREGRQTIRTDTRFAPRLYQSLYGLPS